MYGFVSGKNIWGVGAILSLVGIFIPYVGIVAALAGVILILIAVKIIADEANDRSIYSNYLVSFVLRILSVVIAGISFISIFGFSILSVTRGAKHIEEIGIKGLIIGLIVAIVIFWIIYVISAIYLRRSYEKIAKYTKVDLFRTTGMLYLIGAATLIIAVGAIIIFIAEILEIISYFSLPDSMPKEEATAQI
ncbi:MAG: DUF996 domain-containing protein [Thermoplasmata archaeon]|nr:DUF996 domain-containing protein [Thermoplasmata archaeon]